MANNLLLVDESPLIHRVVELTFEGHDISVYSADDIEEAFALARSLKPDIVIASTHIKRGDGLEFCRELHEDADLAKIPVLLLAGAKDSLTNEEAKEAGAIGVLTKPFEPEKLLSEVGVALSWTSAPPAEAEETAGAAELADLEAPAAGVPDALVDEEDAFLEEVEAPSAEEIPGGDFEGEAGPDELDAFADLREEPEEAPAGEAEDLLGEIEVEIPEAPEEADLGGAVFEAPPEEEPASREEEDLFGDVDIEDLFDEYTAESAAAQAAPAAEEEAPPPVAAEPESLPEIEESPAPPDEGDDELAALQSELSSDLEDIEASHFHEDKVRAAEEELSSLEAELAMEDEASESAPAEAESLGASEDAGEADVSMAEDEEDAVDQFADAFFEDEDSALRGKLIDEATPPPPPEPTETYATPPGEEPPGEDAVTDEGEDLAAMLDEADFGPELDIPLEDASGEEDLTEAMAEEALPPPPPETAAPKAEAAAPEPAPPAGPVPEKDALEPLVEQSLEKAVEDIVPAILRRIETIIVERLPDMVENIVLREIEKIKRGE